MNYNELNIHFHEEYNTFTFNNQEVKVLKYLPTQDKFDLIMTAIQKSAIDGVYNPLRLRVFFALNIMYLYTDLIFDIEHRVDEARLYDEVYTCGLLQEVIDNMEKTELTELNKIFEECVEAEQAYRSTAAAIISKLVDDMPKNAEAAKKIVENFDQNKYQDLLAFVNNLKN